MIIFLLKVFYFTFSRRTPFNHQLFKKMENSKLVQFLVFDKNKQEFVECEPSLSYDTLMNINGKLTDAFRIKYYSRTNSTFSLSFEGDDNTITSHTFLINEQPASLVQMFERELDRWVTTEELSIKRDDQNRVIVHIDHRDPVDITKVSRIYHRCPVYSVLKELRSALHMCTKDKWGNIKIIVGSDLKNISDECMNLCGDLLHPVPFFNKITHSDDGNSCNFSYHEWSDGTFESWSNVLLRDIYILFELSSCNKKIYWINDANPSDKRAAFITDEVYHKLEKNRKEYASMRWILNELNPTSIKLENNVTKCESKNGSIVCVPTSLIPFAHIQLMFEQQP